MFYYIFTWRNFLLFSRAKGFLCRNFRGRRQSIGVVLKHLTHDGGDMHFPRKSVVFVFIFLSLFFALSSVIWAVALSPEIVEKLRNEGKLEAFVTQYMDAKKRGLDEPSYYLESKGGAAVDTIRPIVLCVDFTDNVHSYDTSQYTQLLFTKGYVFPTGSMRDYMWENSYQKKDLPGAVSGWYRMPQPYTYYTWNSGGTGAYPHNAQKLTEDAVTAADPYVNFANFAHGGTLDALIIIHAGPGREETGSDSDIHSHKWQTSYTMVKDGVSISVYDIDPEEHASGALIDMGVFSHELSHTFGAKDMYDYTYTSNGLGKWSIMASGSYLNGGNTPSHIDAFNKYKMGFTTITRLTSNQTNVEVLQAETSPLAYRLWYKGNTGSQYFLVENRQKTRYDYYLPGEGLLIYHCDETVTTKGNDSSWCPGQPVTYHYRAALEQADGYRSLEGCNGLNEGDGGDIYPGFWDVRAFDDTTSPNSHFYADSSTMVAVWNISNSDSSMHANMDVTWSRPNLKLMSFTISDIAPGGNGNGRPEGGETCKLYFTIKNFWKPCSTTTVTGSVDTAGITFSDNSSSLGIIGTGVTVNNNSDPMQFTVDPNFPGKPVIFTLHVQGNNSYYTIDFTKDVWAGNAEILIVDDDTGSVADYRPYYTSALDSLRTIYDIWPSRVSPNITFNKYKELIWFTGDHKTDLFSQAQAESVMSFLDKGGRLFLSSQDAAEVLSASSDPWDTLFLKHYLHVGYAGDNTKYLAVGKSGDEVGDTLYLYPNYEVANQTSKDNLVPDPEADTVLYYTIGGTGNWWTPSEQVAGTKYSGDYFKVVLFGFGFESLRRDGVSFQGQYLSTPQFVMQRVLNWLKAPLPTLNLTSPNGGEVWFIGDTTDIAWQSISFTNKVKIEYSTDAGASWITIADSADNIGTYTLPVPNTPSDSCKVRISDVDNGVPIDLTDGYFAITNFVPGDATGDKVVDVGDVVFLINYLFKSGPVPNPKAAADVNHDCNVEVGDVVYLINYLFKSGPAPLVGCAK
jgi:immune inhibitor A